MEIDTKSWHYKLWHFSNIITAGYIPYNTNLCRYFWRIIFSLMFIFPYYLTWRFVVWIWGYKHVPEKYGRGKYEKRNEFHPMFVTLLIVIFFFLLPVYYPWTSEIIWVYVPVMFVCIALFITLCMVYDHYLGGGLVSNYISAKKRKVCPIIEFKND